VNLSEGKTPKKKKTSHTAEDVGHGVGKEHHEEGAQAHGGARHGQQAPLLLGRVQARELLGHLFFFFFVVVVSVVVLKAKGRDVKKKKKKVTVRLKLEAGLFMQ